MTQHSETTYTDTLGNTYTFNPAQAQGARNLITDWKVQIQDLEQARSQAASPAEKGKLTRQIKDIRDGIATAQAQLKTAPATPLGEEAFDQIITDLAGYEIAYQKAQAEFAKEVAGAFNAAHVIRWQAGPLVQAEFKAAETERLLRAWHKLPESDRTPEKMLEWIKELRSRLANWLLTGHGYQHSSTCAYTNQIGLEEWQARQDLWKNLEWTQHKLEQMLPHFATTRWLAENGYDWFGVPLPAALNK